MASAVSLKKGEAKNLSLTVSDNCGSNVNLTGATLFLGIKHLKSDAAYTLSKEDGDFDKTRAAEGIVSVFLAAADTNQSAGLYVGELKVTFPGSPAVIEKSGDLALRIQEAITP